MITSAVKHLGLENDKGTPKMCLSIKIMKKMAKIVRIDFFSELGNSNPTRIYSRERAESQ